MYTLNPGIDRHFQDRDVAAVDEPRIGTRCGTDDGQRKLVESKVHIARTVAGVEVGEASIISRSDAVDGELTVAAAFSMKL